MRYSLETLMLQTGYTDHTQPAFMATAEAVGAWAREYRLQISAPKSYVTLSTPDTRRALHHPIGTLNHTTLPLECRYKLLEVTSDNQS